MVAACYHAPHKADQLSPYVSPVPTYTPTPTRVPAKEWTAILFPTPTPSPTPKAFAVSAAVENRPVRVIIPDAPLSDYHPLMNQVEDQYGLPRGILWAISIIESTGGLYACGGYNAWGWGNCEHEPSFSSWEEAIQTVAERFAYWVARRGSVDDALCTWQSGRTCAESDNGYRWRVLAQIP